MKSMIKIFLITTLSGIPFGCFATAITTDNYIAVSTYLGGRTSGNLNNTETEQNAETNDSLSQALTISWALNRNKEGELLFSNGKHNSKMSDETNGSTDLYISYLQFGGRVSFVDNSPFSTNISSGIGMTFLTPNGNQYDNEIAFSGNITGGLRYQFNTHWALRGDLRIYGTLLNSNSTIFCADGKCLFTVTGEIYVQTELMAGIEYKF